MISFRYHLVSLAAVLFALAAGVVLGAGPLDSTLGNGVSEAAQRAKVAALDDQVGSLQDRVSYDDAAAAALAPAVLPGRLSGRTVVVVTVPGVDRTQVQQLTDALRTAGATVTGQVAIRRAWTQPDQATVLGTLAEQLAPKGSGLAGSGPYTQAGAVLASALVTDTKASGAPDQGSVAILTGFQEGGFIALGGKPPVAAQLALVVSPGAPVKGTVAAQTANQTLLPLVAALDSGTGATVAGAQGSAEAGGLVAALRASGAVRRVVSSDDVADLSSGIIAAVLALAQEANGRSGQYGMGPGADAAMPDVTATH